MADANGRIGGAQAQLAALKAKSPNADLRSLAANVTKWLATVRGDLSGDCLGLPSRAPPIAPALPDRDIDELYLS
jgi:hypothetical protein